MLPWMNEAGEHTCRLMFRWHGHDPRTHGKHIKGTITTTACGSPRSLVLGSSRPRPKASQPDFETTLPSAVEELARQRDEARQEMSRRDVENPRAASSPE